MENFVMDYILLEVTGKILQTHGKRLRLLLAALLGALFTVSLYLLPVLRECGPVMRQLLNLICAYGMLWLAFRLKGVRETLLFLLVLYGISFAVEGVLGWLEISFADFASDRFPILSIAASFWFGALFVKSFVSCIRERVMQKNCCLSVRIQVGEKELRCRGFMDSGNSLVEPISGKPVVIVEEAVLRKTGIQIPANGFYAIPYHAVGTENGILTGFLADELEIVQQEGTKQFSKVMLGVYEGRLSQKGEYQMLLHPKL